MNPTASQPPTTESPPSNPAPNVTYLTINNVAAMFHLHEKTVARLARTGVLPTKLVGRSVRFRLDELHEAISVAGRHFVASR